MIIQSPNFFGGIEKISELAAATHRVGALLVVVVAEGMSLGLLKAPGDAALTSSVVRRSHFGIPISFGGSYCGFFAVREKCQRQIPGRLVGRAFDNTGREGFVLTLATREQHIRREKATSNICTNQGLYALMATIYLSTLGRHGLREVAEQNLQKAHYVSNRISKLKGYRLRFDSPFFNEFVVESDKPATDVLAALRKSGILGGLALERYFPEMKNSILVTVTELITRQEADRLVNALAEI